MIANYHTHTARCHHAVGTEREYVENAVRRGLKIFGFADHTPQYFPGDYYSFMRMYPQELDAYCDTVRALRKEYAGRLQIHLGILKRFQQQDFVDVLPTEVHILRLGSVALATNPFELFLDFGNQIKARSNAEQTFLIQLANGAEGYLPTAKAERHGHYSAFISSGQCGHQGGDQLVRETLQHIAELFA